MTAIVAWVLLPTPEECVRAGAKYSTNPTVAAWLNADHIAWDRQAKRLLEEIHSDPTRLAMAVRVGKVATTKEVGCELRALAASALLQKRGS